MGAFLFFPPVLFSWVGRQKNRQFCVIFCHLGYSFYVFIFLFVSLLFIFFFILKLELVSNKRMLYFLELELTTCWEKGDDRKKGEKKKRRRKGNYCNPSVNNLVPQ